MVVYDASGPWALTQTAAWRRLVGATLTRWVGMDESVGEDDATEFVGSDSDFQILDQLRLEFAAGDSVDFAIYQNDTTFGLSLEPSDEVALRRTPWNREADLSRLPTGGVESIELHRDARDGNEGDVIEAEVTIAGRRVLIVAAEYLATGDDTVDYGWGEESFFVFVEPAAVSHILWTTPRRFSTETPGKPGMPRGLSGAT